MVPPLIGSAERETLVRSEAVQERVVWSTPVTIAGIWKTWAESPGMLAENIGEKTTSKTGFGHVAEAVVPVVPVVPPLDEVAFPVVPAPVPMAVPVLPPFDPSGVPLVAAVPVTLPDVPPLAPVVLALEAAALVLLAVLVPFEGDVEHPTPNEAIAISPKLRSLRPRARFMETLLMML